MSQKKRVRIYKAGGSTGAYINPTARWMMQMGGASPEENMDEQIMIAVQQGILTGEDPNNIYDSLVSQGMPSQKVQQIINVVMDSIDTMDQEAYVEKSGDQQAAIELAQQEADLMNQQSQNQLNQFTEGAPDINEIIMEDDDYDDYDDEDDLYDMAKGGIPRKADFMKQIKKLGGKIKQSERPEEVPNRFVSTFINSVRNANDAALLEKQAEEYYDNELLPQAQRGREARRARRQERQLNRGLRKIMRNTPAGFMGSGMLPQNIGVINPFGGIPTGNVNQGAPMGYPGLQMANIEVHKTGLFGRPKQYSMAFNYNTTDPVKEAEDVAKSTTQSITDNEAKKEQEGKPSNKEEAQATEQVVEQTVEQSSSTRKAKAPEEKAAYEDLLRKKKAEGMTIDEMVKKGLGTKKGLEALLGSEESKTSQDITSENPAWDKDGDGIPDRVQRRLEEFNEDQGKQNLTNDAWNERLTWKPGPEQDLNINNELSDNYFAQNPVEPKDIFGNPITISGINAPIPSSQQEYEQMVEQGIIKPESYESELERERLAAEARKQERIAAKKAYEERQAQPGYDGWTGLPGESFREMLANEAAPMQHMGRISDKDNFFDDYINPVHWVNRLAGNLGSAPLEAQQSDSYLPYVGAIGEPLIVGALAGIGAKTTGQFLNNLVNPLSGVYMGKRSNVVKPGISGKTIDPLPTGTTSSPGTQVDFTGPNAPGFTVRPGSQVEMSPTITSTPTRSNQIMLDAPPKSGVTIPDDAIPFTPLKVKAAPTTKVSENVSKTSSNTFIAKTQDEVYDHVLPALKNRGANLDRNFSQSQIKSHIDNPNNIEYLGTYSGRPIVEIKMPDGTSELFYKSTGRAKKAGSGAGGTTEGLWQPFGGFYDQKRKPNDFWFIKDHGYSDYYASKSFKIVADNLDNSLSKKLNTSLDKLDNKINFKNKTVADTYVPGQKSLKSKKVVDSSGNNVVNKDGSVKAETKQKVSKVKHEAFIDDAGELLIYPPNHGKGMSKAQVDKWYDDNLEAISSSYKKKKLKKLDNINEAFPISAGRYYDPSVKQAAEVTPATTTSSVSTTGQKTAAQHADDLQQQIDNLQQGGMINPFETNSLAEFIYGGNIPKAQEGWQKPKTFEEYKPKYGWERSGMSDEERAYEKEYSDWKRNRPDYKNDAARQEAINRMNQRIIGYGDGRYNLPNTMYGNPYPYGRGYGNMPTMFNPYGRRPFITRGQTWLQQTGAARDAQGNVVKNPQAFPLTKYEVKRRIFGPNTYTATFGDYNQQESQQKPEKLITDQDLNKQSVNNTNNQFSNVDSKGRLIRPSGQSNMFDRKINRLVRRDERKNARLDEEEMKKEPSMFFGSTYNEEKEQRKQNRKEKFNNYLNKGFSLFNEGGKIPRYQTAGTTPDLDINFQNKSINSYLPKSQQDFNLDINMSNFGKDLDNPFSNPWQDNIGKTWKDRYPLNSSNNEISKNPDGYTTEGKIKQEYDIDWGAGWDNLNYFARSATNYLSDQEQQRQYNLRMLSMDPNAMYTQRDRGDYHTNPGLGSNFRNPSTGFKGVAQEGGQFNIGDELEMTDKEIAEFIAAGGKLKLV